MNGTGRAIRWSTIAAVTGVAVVAGWVSYEHALAVVRAHGESGAVAQVYPVTVDGLIYSASMVLLDAARRNVRAPGLARWLLACGIGATLAANVAAGLHFGPVGAVVAAWPALALVGSYELLMLIIRSGTAPEHLLRVPAAAPVVGETVPDAGQAMTPAGPVSPWPRPVPVMAAPVTGQPDGQKAVNDRPAAKATTTASDRPRRTAVRRPAASRKRGHVRPAGDARQLAVKALRDQPDMTVADLAAAIGRSERTARRIRSEVAAANGHIREEN